MIKFLFLLPIIMCAIWWKFLDSKGYTLKQGLKGFINILIFNTVIIGFFTLMIYLTR